MEELSHSKLSKNPPTQHVWVVLCFSKNETERVFVRLVAPKEVETTRDPAICDHYPPALSHGKPVISKKAGDTAINV